MSDEGIADRIRKKATDQLLTGAKTRMKPWKYLNTQDQLAWCAATIRSVAGAVNDAYIEQRTGGVNFRLTEEDVAAFYSIAQWAQYDIDLLLWRKDEANDAAWQLHYLDKATPEAESQMETAPKQPRKVIAGLPRGCPPLPTPDNPIGWDRVLNEFLKTRREPGVNDG